MNCRQQTTKKYRDRPSPAYPAHECPHQTKLGNDGRVWESVPNAKGVYRWVARTRVPITGSPKKSVSRVRSPIPQRDFLLIKVQPTFLFIHEDIDEYAPPGFRHRNNSYNQIAKLVPDRQKLNKRILTTLKKSIIRSDKSDKIKNLMISPQGMVSYEIRLATETPGHYLESLVGETRADTWQEGYPYVGKVKIGKNTVKILIDDLKRK